jgi:two-component system NtrC family response regulator
MVGKNPKMLQVYQLIEKVAPTHASVLISGESGTGKELVAKAIHRNSPRESKPFIAVNCAALSENLLESELFGHEKGAFTGAIAMRKGRFELADHGTLFLDEVGDIPLALQAKLLRVLQEKTFERVGGGKTLEVDVRVLSATNKDLREEVAAGRFREDLFYRLNVIPVTLPALRERMDDMRLLTDFFIDKYKKELNKENLKISQEAMKLLMKLPWEGNIRELENTIERAAILCSNDSIEAEDVQPDTLYGDDKAAIDSDIDIQQLIPENAFLNDVLYTIEKKMLIQALTDEDYVQSRAADKLGITKSLLQYKMKKYRIKKKK